MSAQTVAVDLDGVLHACDGWKGPDHFNDPVPGALEFLREVVARGYEVVVLTTRPYAQAKRWLEQHGFLEFVHSVTNQKVPAVAYIDDLGVRWDGDVDLHRNATLVAARKKWRDRTTTTARLRSFRAARASLCSGVAACI